MTMRSEMPPMTETPKEYLNLLKKYQADNFAELKRHVYKYTECGAFVEMADDGKSIIVGSIVEGSDFGTARYEWTPNDGAELFGEMLDAVEEEADAIWEWANVVRDNGKTDAEQGLDFPDVRLEYSHLPAVES